MNALNDIYIFISTPEYSWHSCYVLNARHKVIGKTEVVSGLVEFAFEGSKYSLIIENLTKKQRRELQIVLSPKILRY